MSADLQSISDLERFVGEHPAALVYFSSPQCSVCKALRPKVEAMLRERFPKMAMGCVDCLASPDVAGQYAVFSIPALLLFMDGRETGRYIRTFSMAELAGAITRPYHLMFEA